MDPDDPSPGVTWTLQRRIPHAGVYSLNDATKEGDTNDPDDTYLAKLWFWRDDRITEDLTLNFTIGGQADESDYTAIMKTPDGEGGFTEENFDLASGTITLPAGTFADPIMGIEVDITATDDEDPEWTENLTVRLQDDDETYVADHPNDDDGNDSDGDSSDEDPDAVLYLKDNDLSFDLQQGTLVANYNDTNGNHVTDYEEWGTDSDSDPDLYEMTLNIPSGYEPNSSVTLTTTGGFFNIYDSQSKDNLLSDSGTVTWDDPTNVPHSVWLEVKQGSTSIDDITETLYSTDNGDDQVFDQHNTAVNFHIQLGGNPNGGASGNVENQQINWLIGQMSDLYASIEAPAEFTAGATYAWSVPGNVLHDYAMDNTEAHTVPIAANDMQGEEQLGTGTAWPEVQFFWVSASAASDEREVSVQLANVNGQSYTVKTNFKVYEPTVTFGNTFSGGSIVSQGILTLYGLNQLRPNGSPRGGIEVPTTVQMPTGFAGTGSWKFLQTCTSSLSRRTAAGVWEDMSNNGVLDLLDFGTEYPYVTDANGANAATVLTTGQSQFVMHDTPALPLTGGYNYGEVNNLYKLYVMFQAPGDSRWVPTQMVMWNWFAQADKNVPNFLLPGSEGPNPQAPVRVSAPPTWNDMVQNGTWI